jgi:hypothetical protein
MAMSTIHRFSWALVAVGLVAGLALAGCGTPGAPLPPSLNLPDPVADLAATRAGSQVTLTWTMPKKNTDKLLLKGNIAVRVCRKEGVGSCDSAGSELSFAPGAEGAFTDPLPAALATGPPRSLSYFVELPNRNGRSAGLSNAAQVLAGEAPAPVTQLTAEARKAGVALRWEALGTGAQESSPAAIRLHRKLLTPPAAKPQQGPLAPQPEPLEQNLLVDSCGTEERMGFCRTLDKDIHFGQSYEYRAQRVAQVTVDGKTIELAGELSAPVRIDVLDIFPPEVPTGLAAVATVGENSSAPAIELSWQPVSDADLAGYAVYRSQNVGEGDSVWQRISPAEPLVPPAFHDTQVLPGKTYRYAVSSFAQNGHESARSVEAQETVPNP